MRTSLKIASLLTVMLLSLANVSAREKKIDFNVINQVGNIVNLSTAQKDSLISQLAIIAEIAREHPTFLEKYSEKERNDIGAFIFTMGMTATVGVVIGNNEAGLTDGQIKRIRSILRKDD